MSSKMPSELAPALPSLPWRVSSATTLGLAASICKVFMVGLERTEIHGLPEFLSLLDSRQNPAERERGLITVSNHISIIDDPFMWAALPLKYCMDADNMRWGLGSYDLCFKNKPLSTFFMLGQVLPTHRQKHSVHGGPFQATMTQAVRLLSDPWTHAGLDSKYPSTNSGATTPSPEAADISDPFSSANLTYTTNGTDAFQAISAYRNRKHGWIHIFPEGRVHQHPHRTMRYFRWGVARLILEADQCPDIVPIWIEGCDQIMHEDRKFPRFLPRLGRQVGIWFGENVRESADGAFADLRRRWQKLVEKDAKKNEKQDLQELGELSEELKYGKEAVELRKECTLAVRQEMLKLRRKRGLPDEDPKQSLVETWIEEGLKDEGKMRDGSWVKDV